MRAFRLLQTYWPECETLERGWLRFLKALARSLPSRGVKGQAGLFWGEYLLGPRHLFLSVVSTSLLLLPRPAPPELHLHARRDRHNLVDLHVLLR